MAKYLASLTVILCLFASAARASGEAGAAESGETEITARDPVALVAFGDVDDGLMVRIQKWTSHNLALPVPVFDAMPQYQFETFEEVVEAAEQLLPENQLGLVVIWRPSSDKIQNHGANYPDKRIAVANLNPMFTPGTDPEKIERRVERQAIRGICMVMGIEPSPNPMSAMFNYRSMEELDRMGRNLDLPWLVRVQKAAVAAGIKPTPDSPFNVSP